MTRCRFDRKVASAAKHRFLLLMLAVTQVITGLSANAAKTSATRCTCQIFPEPLNDVSNAIFKTFSDGRYRGMFLETPPLASQDEPSVRITDGFLLVPMDAITNVPFRKHLVPYRAYFQIALHSIDPTNTEACVKTVKSQIIDGLTIFAPHGGKAERLRNYPPISQEETNVLKALSICISEGHISEILHIIANPHSTTNQLVDALRDLKNSKQKKEPASFWTSIANDSKYSWDHRRRAVLQLFARHFREGMTFAEVGRLLDHPNWIDRGCISMSAVINGPQPPNVEFDESVVRVSVGPCHSSSYVDLIFVTRNDSVDLDDNLYGCLTGTAISPKLAQLRIRSVISDERINDNNEYNLWGFPPE